MAELYRCQPNVEQVATCNSSGLSDKKWKIVSRFCEESDDFEETIKINMMSVEIDVIQTKIQK